MIERSNLSIKNIDNKIRFQACMYIEIETNIEMSYAITTWNVAAHSCQKVLTCFWVTA